MPTMYEFSHNNIPPYECVVLQTRLRFPVSDTMRTFIVGVYCAYNVGIVAPENNGIVILDDDRKQVLTDQIAQEITGYFGPTDRQVKEYRRITAMSYEDFRAFVNNHDRSRYEL